MNATSRKSVGWIAAHWEGNRAVAFIPMFKRPCNLVLQEQIMHDAEFIQLKQADTQ
jgi:hypothetical protein